MDISELQDCLSLNTSTKYEVRQVMAIGERMYHAMRKHRWLRHTKFPEGFACCRTENDLRQMIDNFNGWRKEVTTDMTLTPLHYPSENPKREKQLKLAEKILDQLI